MGLHKAVSLCMDHCYNSEVFGDDNWYKTVVLSGGSSCLPGLSGMLPCAFLILTISEIIDMKINWKTDASFLSCE